MEDLLCRRNAFHDIQESSVIVTSDVVESTQSKSKTMDSSLTVVCAWTRVTDVSTKFEVDTTIGCLVISLLLLIRYVTL